VYIFGYISKLVRIKVPEEMLAKNTPVDEGGQEFFSLSPVSLN
jgi:hypothetical protein